MSYGTIKDYEALLNRIIPVFQLATNFPDWVSDEEAEGLVQFLPADPANSISALLAPPVRRAALAYLKLIREWLLGAVSARQEGKKVILVPFNFPPELIHCFETAFPLTSEVLSIMAISGLYGQGERYWDIAMGIGLPDTLCSSSTIEIGSALTGADFKPDAIVSAAPGSCDANAKVHEFAARYLGIPQFLLDKPVDDTERAREQYLKYFKKLVRDLEEFIGEELSEERMRIVLEKANRATDLYYDLWELRKAKPSPCPNLFTYLVYAVKFTMWGTDHAINVLQVMVDTVRERLARGEYEAPEEVARCFWIYTLYYWDLMGFFNWMDKKGITICGDLIGSFFLQPINTTSKESMINGLTDTCWGYAMTRQMGANSMHMQWLEDILYWVSELGADSAIYCGHHSCKQTWSVFSITRNELMKRRNIPTLMLQGDAWIRRMTPMSVIQEQIEEFVNNVVIKRKRKHVRV